METPSPVNATFRIPSWLAARPCDRANNAILTVISIRAATPRSSHPILSLVGHQVRNPWSRRTTNAHPSDPLPTRLVVDDKNNNARPPTCSTAPRSRENRRKARKGNSGV